MRIAHFLQGRCNPESANGVDKTVNFLSLTQAAMGHTVAVFSISEKPPLPIAGVDVRTYPPEWQPFARVAALVEDLRAWRPTLVHLHSGYVPANIMLARELRRMGTPYVVTPNGVLASQLLTRRRHLKVPYKYLFELPFLNRAAFVHSVGDVFAIQQYGVRVPIVLAPNGFDIGSIPPGLPSDAIVRRWPSAEGRRVALFVGRLDVEQKGLDLLLHGFQQATNREEWVLVLVGPDWSGGLKTLNRMATQLGIDHEVCFWGPAFGREKFELLASADAFVCASRWEGFPFSVIEALASGLPCVVTAAADPMGLVTRSGAGRTVDPVRREVAAAISELGRVGSADLRKMGEKGRELVARELSWDAIARTIEEAYARYCAV